LAIPDFAFSEDYLSTRKAGLGWASEVWMANGGFVRGYTTDFAIGRSKFECGTRQVRVGRGSSFHLPTPSSRRELLAPPFIAATRLNIKKYVTEFNAERRFARVAAKRKGK
jgi:hypothetical protein